MTPYRCLACVAQRETDIKSERPGQHDLIDNRLRFAQHKIAQDHQAKQFIALVRDAEISELGRHLGASDSFHRGSNRRPDRNAAGNRVHHLDERLGDREIPAMAMRADGQHMQWQMLGHLTGVPVRQQL
ncbi:hypothetical protein X741_29765 [Mesorhizobium sp. LNHC229A00]|nr:hypothetical protein X741_29765 [Mesorhizobium sp. LNHC229A00]